MKIEYSIKHSVSSFDLDSWIKENEPKMKGLHMNNLKGLKDHYVELIDDFKEFLNSKDVITDKEGIQLTPIDVYNAIEYYKIRIQKLWLIFGLRLYKTYNINKDTKVRYIVMRAFWIDDFGKPFRKFSKNLGAENKVMVKGQIPQSDMDAVEDYILTLMSDLYSFEYFDNDRVWFDENGNFMMPNDNE